MRRLFVLLTIVALSSCSTDVPVSPGGLHKSGETISCIDNSGFDIDLVFVDNGLSKRQRATIELAAIRWEEIIIGDVQDMFYSREDYGYVDAPSWSGKGTRIIIKEPIDDIRIFVSAVQVEGRNFAAIAAPYSTWPDLNRPPIFGWINFDPVSADQLEDSRYGVNTFYNVAVHEIAHALGFHKYYLGYRTSNKPNILSGFTWDEGLLYVGDNATEYLSFMIQGFLSLEDPPPLNGVPLIDGGHLRDSFFGDEAMIAGWSSPYRSPVSIITMLMLKDIGYEIDFSKADDYDLNIT